MKNILLLNGTLHIGGAENVISTLAKNIDASKFNITICHINQGGAVKNDLVASGYKVVSIPRSKNGKANYLSALSLRHLIKELDIDIVHSHDLASFFDASICRIIMPGIRHIHTYHFGNYPHRPLKYLFMEKIMWRIPDCLVAVGNSQKMKIQKTFGMADKHIRTIWNGINMPEKKILGEISKNTQYKNKILVGSISTLIPQKAIHELLQVIEQLHKKRDDFKVIIVGHGDLREELEIMANKLGIGEVVSWMGWVENASSTVLPALDIFVQTSHWEAMSVVILEAMASKKAIVATDVGENKDVLDDGITGYVVDAGDIEAFYEKLNVLIDDKVIRDSFGSQAKISYEKEFTAAKMAEAYESIYERL